jgi:4-hydroxybenzoate polyprenyltransferase
MGILQAALAAAPWMLLVGATFIHTTIPDIPGDEATGKISTAVLLGTRRSLTLATVLHILAIAAALAARSTPALIMTLVASPAAGYVFLNRTAAASSLYVQATTLVVAAGTIVMWPAFALVFVPLVALSRFYHRKRFDITYPGTQKAA